MRAGARSKVAIRPATRTTRLATGESGVRVRMAWPGVSRNTKIVSCLGATVCVSLWRSGAAIQPCDTAAACCYTACDTVRRALNTERNARGMGLGVTIQFCITTGGRRYGRRQPVTRRPGATIRRSTRHDTTSSARPGHSTRAAWAQCACSLGLGCAPCAPNPVSTQDTVLSHCLNQCS